MYGLTWNGIKGSSVEKSPGTGLPLILRRGGPGMGTILR